MARRLLNTHIRNTKAVCGTSTQFPTRDVTRGRTLHGFTSISAFTLSNATAAVETDATKFLGEAGSVRFTLTNTSADVDVIVREDLRDRLPIIFPFRSNITEPGAINDDSIRVRITDSQGFGLAYAECLAQVVAGQVNYFVFDPASATLSGTIDWSDIRTIRITYLNGVSGLQFWLGRLTYGKVGRAKVLFTFDDEYKDVYTVAKPIMDAAGFAGVIGYSAKFQDPLQVDTTKYMSDAQLLEMSLTWDICSHSFSHAGFVSADWTQADILADLQANDARIASKGIIPSPEARSLYIAPFGEVDDDVRAALVQTGRYWARTTLRGRQSSSDNPPFDIAESIYADRGSCRKLKCVNPRSGVYRPAYQYTTTVNGAASNTVQTLVSVAGINPGDELYFATSNAFRIVQSVNTGAKTVTLTATISTTNGETVTNGSMSKPAPGTLGADILEAARYGGLVPIVFHSIPLAAKGDSGNDLVYNSGDFQELVNFCAFWRDLFDVCTWTEYLKSVPSYALPSAPTALAPASVPGLKFLCDFDTASLFSDAGTTPAVVGGPIQQANDQSGNGFNASAPGADKLTLVSVTNNGVTFKAAYSSIVNAALQTGAMPVSQPYTIVLVGRSRTTQAANCAFCDGGGAGNRASIYRKIATTPNRWAATANTELYDGVAGARDTDCDTGFHLFSVVFNGAKSNLFVDGMRVAGDANTHNLDKLTIGNVYLLNRLVDVDVAFILVSSLDLYKTGHLERLWQYIAPLKGITLKNF